MASGVLACLLVALLICFSSAQTTTIQELCSTGYGAASPSNVPTSFLTTSTTSLVVVRSKTTPISTITAPPSTTYVTETDTVFTTVYSTTDTFTETTQIETFITSTGLTTFTVFVTDITTVTEPTPTSTVPTSPGFTYPSPIPGETATQRKRYEARPEPAYKDAFAEKRGISDSGRVQQAHLDLVQGTVKPSPAQYPTSVLCTEIIKVLSTSTVVRTARPSTTTAPGPTITSTITSFTSSTVSYYESFTVVTVSTTLTGTLLTYITTTTTTTTTETATLIPPTQTLYAACDAQNIIYPPPGHYFASTSYDPPSFQTTVQTPHNTSYECCVACITSTFCKVAEYFSDPEFDDVHCYLDFGDSKTTCDPETVNVSIGNSVAGFNQSVSGGNCGGRLSFRY